MGRDEDNHIIWSILITRWQGSIAVYVKDAQNNTNNMAVHPVARQERLKMGRALRGFVIHRRP